MVVIQCPHCEQDIELEDGVSGLFDCPHCGNGFSFGDNELVAPNLFGRSQLFMSRGMKIGLAINAIGVITFMGFAIFEMVVVAHGATMQRLSSLAELWLLEYQLS